MVVILSSGVSADCARATGATAAMATRRVASTRIVGSRYDQISSIDVEEERKVEGRLRGRSFQRVEVECSRGPGGGWLPRPARPGSRRGAEARARQGRATRSPLTHTGSTDDALATLAQSKSSSSHHHLPGPPFVLPNALRPQLRGGLLHSTSLLKQPRSHVPQFIRL